MGHPGGAHGPPAAPGISCGVRGFIRLAVIFAVSSRVVNREIRAVR